MTCLYLKLDYCFCRSFLSFSWGLKRRGQRRGPKNPNKARPLLWVRRPTLDPKFWAKLNLVHTFYGAPCHFVDRDTHLGSRSRSSWQVWLGLETIFVPQPILVFRSCYQFWSNGRYGFIDRLSPKATNFGHVVKVAPTIRFGVEKIFFLR